jgi:magnesium chelatase family protein
VAAAGHHNLLMTDPPCSGKTMLAKSLSTKIPHLTYEETLVTTKIHSVTGKSDDHTALKPKSHVIDIFV